MRIRRAGAASARLALIALAMSLATTRATIAQVVEDLTPPSIAGFDMGPRTINVLASAQNVTVRMRVVDDLSGFYYGCFFFRSPTLTQIHAGCISDYLRESGTSLDGTYRTDVVFPQFSESGEWHLYQAYVVDIVGNFRSYSEDDLAGLGFPTTLEVVAVPDSTPPAIVGLTIAPDVIDVSGGAQAVTVTERVTDDSAGVYYGCFFFRSPTWIQIHAGCISDYFRESGNNLDGTYRADVTFPQFSEAGEWHLYQAYVVDIVGNFRGYSEQELIDAGFSTVLRVQSDPDDTKPPVVSSVSFSPTAVNTSAGPQTVSIFEGVTDNLAGFYYGCFFFRSPTWAQIHAGCISDNSRESGNGLDGTYRSDLIFPQYGETGEWHLYQTYVVDLVGNFRGYSEQDLVDRGFSTVLTVSANTPPAANAGSDQTVEATSPAGAVVMLDASASSDADGDALTYTWREQGQLLAGPSGNPVAHVTLALGVHQIALMVDDGKGASDTATIVVEVVDTTPPALSLSVSPNVLWPPDHRLVEVSAAIQVSDAGDARPRVELLSITSNEPDNGLGDGDTGRDVQQASVGTDDRAFALRAERSGRSTGRVYTVTYRAADASGNSTTGTATVTIPKSQK